MKNISTYVNTRDGKVILIVKVKGKRFSISTPMTSSEKFSGAEVPQTVNGYKAKTTLLRRWYADMEEYIANHPKMDADALKNALKAVIQGTDPDKAAMTERTLVAVLRSLAKTKRAKNTQLAYQCTARNVEAYDTKIEMDAVTPEWLASFESHERGKGRMTNGIAIDLRNIRAAFNYALANGWTDCYPFRRYKIKYEQTRKRNLSREQVVRIMKNGDRYADTFLLMLYLIGINISDLYYLPKDCIRDGRLEYRRNKTGRLFSIRVEPEAQNIINRYAGKEYLLCFAETCRDYKVFLHHMNKNLGKVVQGCTSYWSRHTWASLAALNDIPIETISHALGHSVGASVTNIYIQYDTKKVDEANRRVIDFVLHGNKNRPSSQTGGTKPITPKT